MQDEVWVPVKNWEEFYEVSTKGRVRSLDREYWVTEKRWGTTYKVKAKGRILKPSYGRGDFYPKYVFTRGAEFPKVDVQAHRLVAEHFIPNPDNKPVAHHIDHDKRNCSVENLCWATPKENTQAAREAGVLKAKSKKNRRISDDQVKWMKHLYQSGQYTERALCEIFNTGIANVRQLCDITHKPARHRNKWCFNKPFEITIYNKNQCQKILQSTIS